jgi:hypothetical protein
MLPQNGQLLIFPALTNLKQGAMLFSGQRREEKTFDSQHLQVIWKEKKAWANIVRCNNLPVKWFPFASL